jgi:hypothetical protein
VFGLACPENAYSCAFRTYFKERIMKHDPIPLKPSQVEAACRLHSHLLQWQRSESALTQLREKFPGFDSVACLLKTVAVNAIYGTQVYAIVPMADKVEQAMSKDLSQAGPELVERIAALQLNDGATKRLFVSFAAKFCHFFVDEERFPIYDEAARSTLRLHLGGAYGSNTKHPYVAFCENFGKVHLQVKPTCRTSRDLDHYLWLVGMYRRWLKQREQENPVVNKELLDLFSNPGPYAPDLHALLPTGIERTFKVER